MDEDSALPPGVGQSEVDEDGFAAPPSGEEPTADGGGAEDPHGRVINYYFPLEVVVTAGVPERERELLQEAIWQELHDAVSRRLA